MASPATSFRTRRPKGSDVRSKTVGTAVTEGERDWLLQALSQAAFHGPADGVRKVLFAFASSPEVRAAVQAAIAEHQIA